MNILFCDPQQANNQGAQAVHIYEVSSNLSKLGHNIVFLSTEHLKDWQETKTKRAISLWAKIRSSLSLSPISGFLKREIVDHWLWVRELRLFISVFILLVRRKQSFDVIYRRHHLFNSEYLLGKLFRIPVIKEVNGIITDEIRIAGQRGNISLRIIDRIERFNMSKADKIIVVALKMKELLHTEYKIPEDRLVVAENGANTELFKPMKEDVKAGSGLDSNYSYIGYIGSFATWHGLDDLVRSAPLVLKQVPNAKFLLVGDGQEKDEIIRTVNGLNLKDNFIFMSGVPYEEVPRHINMFDICIILKKKGILGSPLKLYEYMACGKPVVATRTEDFHILEESSAGLLVDSEEPQELAGAIIKLLQNVELMRLMGENGRKYVVENQSWEIVAGRVAEVCESTIREYKK